MKIWCLDYRDQIYTDATMRNVTRYRGMKFFRGIRYAEQFPSDGTVEVKSKRPPTDFFHAGIFWVISSKIRDILEFYNVEAEYFRLRVVDKKGNSFVGEWWCFNPTLVLNWFDRSQSRFVLEQDFATHIESIVINSAVLNDVPLSVAEKTIPVLVCARDDIAKSIVSNKCSGVVFRDPQDWQNPANPVT